MNHIEKDPLQKRLDVQNWVVLGVLTLISFVFSSTFFAVGVLCGGIVSIANYYLLNLSLKKAFKQVSDKTKSFLMIRYFFRFMATGIILFLLITQTPISVVGLIIGLSVVVINIVVTTLFEVSKKNLILKIQEVS